MMTWGWYCMTNMVISNYVIALIAAVIGSAIAYTSYGYGIQMSMFGPGAGFWPFILGICLIIVSVLLVADTIYNHQNFKEQKVILITIDNILVYQMMAAVIAYVVLLPIMGFYLSTILFLSGAMYLLGARKLTLIACVSLIFNAVIYVVFDELLSLSFPLPFFIE